MQDKYPSYKFLLSKDLTALPEFFDEGKNLIGSNCHPVFGSVLRWLMRAVGSIEVLSEKRIRVAPAFIQDLEYANAYHNTRYGRVTVEWKRSENGTVALSVTRPREISLDLSLPKNCIFSETVI